MRHPGVVNRERMAASTAQRRDMPRVVDLAIAHREESDDHLRLTACLESGCVAVENRTDAEQPGSVATAAGKGPAPGHLEAVAGLDRAVGSCLSTCTCTYP